MVSYKLFCDFDGKPIRRNRFKQFNAAYCNPITSKYREILSKSIKQNPSEYKSFVSFLKKDMIPQGSQIMHYALNYNIKEKVIHDLHLIKKSTTQIYILWFN